MLESTGPKGHPLVPFSPAGRGTSRVMPPIERYLKYHPQVPVF